MNICAMDLGSIKDTVFFQDETWEVSHDLPGWLQLDERLPADCEVVFEGRCAALEVALGHRPLACLDPGRSAQIRRALQEAKDDRRDARMLAQLRQLRAELFQPIESRDPELQQLRDLTRTRRSLVEYHTKLLQQLQAEQHRGGQAKVQWLSRFSGTPFEGLVRVLKTLQEEIGQLEKKIKQQGRQVTACELLRTIKGMGANLSGEIIAEVDAFEAMQTHARARAYIGTAPVTLASGKKTFVRLRRRCNHRARNALYLFAFCSLRFHPWARAYYDACRARGIRHSSALIALANRWVPVLFQMVKKNEPYDPGRKTFCSA